MVSTISCFLLLGIIILANGNNNNYKERSEGLIQKLSSLKEKHGLNFVHIEGAGSLLEKFKKSHPRLHYIETDDPRYSQSNAKNNINHMKNFKLLVAMNRFKGTPLPDKDSNQVTRMKSLRICRKVPKKLKCNNGNCELEESKKGEEECNSNKKKEDKQNEKEKTERKRYYRAGYNKKHDNVDETAKLLDDLENLLAKNGKYNIFLGCVGDKCRGRSNRDRYEEDRDNAEVEREYLGCTGDRCGRSRDDDDTDVRGRY